MASSLDEGDEALGKIPIILMWMSMSGPVWRQLLKSQHFVEALKLGLKMKKVTLFLTLALCFNNINCQEQYKTLVTYLGTDFIMNDGCPPPKCDPSLRDCRKEQIDQEAEYNACIRYSKS